MDGTSGDGNGQVTQEEFVKHSLRDLSSEATSDKKQTAKLLAQIAFNRIDQNGDGKLDYKELGAVFATLDRDSEDKQDGVITSEEFEQYTTRENLSISTVFPDYEAKGITKITKSSLTDSSYLCVVYSLQNVGKEDVVSGEESVGDGSYWALPYGTIEVNYDDGYTFSGGIDGFTKYFGFTNTLKVLSDPITEVMIFDLPNQVFENDDKPLNLKVTLPSSNEETEEFIVSIR